DTDLQHFNQRPFCVTPLIRTPLAGAVRTARGRERARAAHDISGNADYISWGQGLKCAIGVRSETPQSPPGCPSGRRLPWRGSCLMTAYPHDTGRKLIGAFSVGNPAPDRAPRLDGVPLCSRAPAAARLARSGSGGHVVSGGRLFIRGAWLCTRGVLRAGGFCARALGPCRIDERRTAGVWWTLRARAALASDVPARIRRTRRVDARQKPSQPPTWMVAVDRPPQASAGRRRRLLRDRCAQARIWRRPVI